MAENLVLLGGIPRSGTTLTCRLLNQVSNTLALVEPLDMNALLAASGPAGRAEFIRQFAAQIRRQVLAGEAVRVKALDGEQTNTFAADASEGGKRKNIITGEVDASLGKAFTSEFLLLIKHPNAFAALLPELRSHFSVYMHVRSPLSILASWHSLDHPLSMGHAPMAESFDKALKATLAVEGDSLNRQIALLNWYFSRFLDYLPRTDIIRYEDVVASNGRQLANIVPAAAGLTADLQLRNRNPLYDDAFMVTAAERLLALGGAWQLFYSAQDIEQVLSGTQA